jgi:IPT/TIG domain/Bacterial Ig-like domain (group 2)
VHTSSLLLNGMVLFAGGYDSDFLPEASAELYQPGTLTPANLVSITVNPPNPSVGVGLVQTFAAAGAFGDGSTQVLTSVTWSSSNPAMASITNDATNHGNSLILATGSATISACAGSVCGSTAVTFLPPALTITNILPSTGSAGTIVNIGGTSFGATQGASTVTFNGTSANVITWSSAGILVSVPSGATTGNVVVAVSGAQSNGLPFTMLPPPNITSVSPTTGPAGTSVTITGSGFGTAPGQSVRFNTVEALVSSWSDSSITVSVPSNAVTGPVTVTTADGLLSNGVSFTVPLTIIGVDPTSGPVGTVVAVSGSSFGATQGTGSASIGSAPLAVFSWSDTQIVATVLAGTTTGAVNVQQGGILISGPTFSVSSAFSPYRVVPQTLSLLVGQTRTVSVTDSIGNPVHGLVWTTNNSSIVSLSTDDPPVIAAVAPGSATVYAGGVPVAVTVYTGTALPSGTPVWSLPISVSRPSNIAPAVPSDTGVDVFAMDTNGMLSAVSNDGTILWTAGPTQWDDTIQVGNTNVILERGTIIPDFSGNAVLKPAISFFDGQNQVHTTHAVTRIDPTSHQLSNLYTFDSTGNGQYTLWDGFSIESVVPDTTGTLFVQDNAKIMAFDLSTGQQKASPTLKNGTCSNISATDCGPGVLGQLIVAGDGNAYVPYEYQDSSWMQDPNYFRAGTSQIVTHWMLLRFSPDGTYANIELSSETVSGTCVKWFPPGVDPGNPDPGTECTGSAPVEVVNTASVITNQGTGVAVFGNALYTGCAHTFYNAPLDEIVQSDDCPPDLNLHTQIAYVSQDSVTSQMNDASMFPRGSSGFRPGLQLEDGSYVGIEVHSDANGVPQNTAIDVSSGGGQQWSQLIGPAADGGVTPIAPLYALSDGSVTITSSRYDAGVLGTISTLDPTGNIVSQVPDTGTQSSWTGRWYADGGLSQVSQLPLILADAFQSVAAGNQSHNGTAIEQQWYPPLVSCKNTNLNPPMSCPGPNEAIYNALADLITRLQDPNVGQLAQSQVFNKLGNGLTTASFIAYLSNRTPQFYNALLSTYCYDALTDSVDRLLCHIPLSSFFLRTVKDVVTIKDFDASSGTPSSPLLTFVRPTSIGLASQGDNLGNEGLIFHEALHGVTGMADNTILDALGLNSTTHAPCSIAVRIQNKVLKNSQGLDPTIVWSCPTVGDE